MYYVYVIESLRNKKRYVGFTSKPVSVRLEEHNRGTNKWTGQNRPFKLIYYEEFQSEREARKREKFLKTGKGREYIRKIVPV